MKHILYDLGNFLLKEKNRWPALSIQEKKSKLFLCPYNTGLSPRGSGAPRIGARLAIIISSL